jgi:hypothetical protein
MMTITTTSSIIIIIITISVVVSVTFCHYSVDYVKKGGKAGHVTRCNRNSYRVWWGNLKVRDHLEDLDMVGKIILECVWKK